MPQRIIAVTGANKGIGFQVMRQLLQKEPDSLIVLGSRNEVNGQEAISKLHEEGMKNVCFLQCDVSSESSCNQFVEGLEKLGGCNLLINNAGINWKPAKEMFETNFYGTRRLSLKVWKAWPNCRITNVSSLSGTSFPATMDDKEREALFETTDSLLATITDKEVCAFVDNDVEKRDPKKVDDKDGTYDHSSAYGASKFAINMMTEVFGRVGQMNAVCPGICKTDMIPNEKHHLAPLTDEEGADRVIDAAYKNPFENGAYYEEKKRCVARYPAVINSASFPEKVRWSR